MKKVNSERWKILQALPIEGENDLLFEKYKISADEFSGFLKINESAFETIDAVAESNDSTTETYVMIDPAGRFFENSNGKYIYSKPILEAGIHSAIREMNYSYQKFVERGGLYKWD